MDIQRKCFEESNNVNPDWSFKFDEELQQYIALDSEMELQVDEFNELWDAFRAGWQAAKAQAVQQWISVEDKLPSDDIGRVLAWVVEQNSLGKCGFAWNCSHSNGVFSDKFETFQVTHWMPLPDAPQEQAIPEGFVLVGQKELLELVIAINAVDLATHTEGKPNEVREMWQQVALKLGALCTTGASQ